MQPLQTMQPMQFMPATTPGQPIKQPPFAETQPSRKKEVTFRSLIQRVDQEDSLQNLSTMDHDAKMYGNLLSID